MDLLIRGKGQVTLTKADFKAAGGEGAVYCRDATAYKLYGQTDGNGRFRFAPQKMIPPGKIAELSALTDPDIVAPQDVLLDPAGTPVGYTMRAVMDAIPLCQTFTKAFRDRNHLSPDHLLKLTRKLEAGVRHVHARGILIVDLNEMNFLVDASFERVYFIDVDSYQTAHYPATALMDSVRDRHSPALGVGSDWFAFAVVSFQMLVGIHPYKGKHPSLLTLDARMQANVSVLNAAVSVPGVCQPFSVIPPTTLDWYRAVFERGLRVPPPNDLGAVVVLPAAVRRVPGADNFVIAEAGMYDGRVVAVIGGIVLTTRGVWSGAHRTGDAPAGAVLGVTLIHHHPVTAWIENGLLRVCDVLRGQECRLSVAADAAATAGGRIIARQNGTLYEVSLTELPPRLLAGADVIGNVLPQSTQLFEGVAVQNLLGAAYLGMLPTSGGFHEVRVPELDGYRVADAKFERGVFVAVGVHSANSAGRYDRFVLRFDDALATYDCRRTEDVGMAAVNFAVLDTGVVALINEGEALELFPRACGASGLKVARDKAIDGGCRLFSRGAQALFARDDGLYTVAMNVN